MATIRLTFGVIIARMAAWSAVTVPKKSYDFPALCPDCLQTGPLTNVLIPADLRIEIPFCEACAARQARWRRLARPLMILAVLIAFAAMIWFDLRKLVAFWIAIALVLPTVWLTDYRGRVVRVKSCDLERIVLEFKRSEYAQQFGEVNKIAVVAAR
jgi:hypothetical protein